MIGTAGAGKVALADESPLDPAACPMAAFKLVAVMNGPVRSDLLLRGLPGKVDQIQIVLILRCRVSPSVTHPRRGVKAA